MKDYLKAIAAGIYSGCLYFSLLDHYTLPTIFGGVAAAIAGSGIVAAIPRKDTPTPS